MKILFVLIGIFVAAHASANPFMQGGTPTAGVNAMGFLGTPFIAEILVIQKQVHEAISNNIEQLKAGISLTPLWGLLIGSFLYGVFHVLAPGHGKIIIASYFLGQKARWQEGVWAALIMAIGHTITAIGIVGVLYAMIGLSQFGTLAAARYVELIGYGLIVAIGVWLLLRKLENKNTCHACGHAHEGHEHHHHDKKIEADKKGLSLFAATSLVPCTGSMIILLFTLANNVLWAGIVAVLFIAIGMWLTMTSIGFMAIFLRLKIEGKDGVLSAPREKLVKVLGVFGSIIIILVGGMFFYATLSAISV